MKALEVNQKTALEFRKNLLAWAGQINRPMPWKGEKNPYFIWLSEIILQQTRVEQGWNYYLKFKEAYPTVHDLAKAEEDHVLKNWQGLGYYSRARNLHKAAKMISEELDGKFPDQYDHILELPGVGPYTAAAIASFAFDLPEAVLDGNVYRVLSRVFNIDTPTDSTAGKKQFRKLAYHLLDQKQPGKYNQAIMDFGAICCSPKSPDCPNCPMGNTCLANDQKTIAMRPVKGKKAPKKDRYFHYLRITSKEKILLQKRIKKDIWANLYEFPLVETSELLQDSQAILALFDLPEGKDNKPLIIRNSRIFKQTLSHQNIYAQFLDIELKDVFQPSKEEQIWVPNEKVEQYAFPKIIDCFLKDNSLSLFN